jgi:hypothetical protein
MTAALPGFRRAWWGPRPKLLLHAVERTVKIPVMVGYDGALLTADGTAAFTRTEFSIPIPKFLWFVLDAKVTVGFHAKAETR